MEDLDGYGMNLLLVEENNDAILGEYEDVIDEVYTSKISDEEQQTEIFDKGCPIIDLREVTLKPEPIGRGVFGVVYEGCWRGAKVACKQMNTKTMSKEEFQREAGFMRLLGNHPNVVMLVGCAIQDEGYWLIAPYFSNGSVYDYCRTRSDIPLEVICSFARDAAAGVLHLHCEKVVHRDVAARNFLVNSNLGVELSDFGLTSFCNNAHNLSFGPVRHMAPEALRGEGYTTKSDAFAFGVFLWELFTRCKELPWKDRDLRDIAVAVCEGERLKIPSKTPHIIKELIADCWADDPDERPDFYSILLEIEQLAASLRTASERKKKTRKKKKKKKQDALEYYTLSHPERLQELSHRMKNGVEVKRRTYHLLPYFNCFIGSEAVDWLLANTNVETRASACLLGDRLIVNKLIEHVKDKHKRFDDAYLFYRFCDVSTKVVVAGGGFAGSLVARKLQNLCDVTLIDTKEYFEFIPSFPVVSAIPSYGNKIRSMHTSYLKHTKVVVDEQGITSVDKKTVTLGNGKQIPYDYLCLCTGSYYDLKKIDQPKQHIVNIKSLQDIMNAYPILHDAKYVVIAGGGSAGVEFACEIGVRFPEKEVTIVEKHAVPMHRFSSAAKHINSFLKRTANIKMMINSVVTVYENDVVTIKTINEESTLPTFTTCRADIVYGAFGAAPVTHYMKHSFKETLTDSGEIKVNRFFRVYGQKNIFALGDIAAIQVPRKKVKKLERSLTSPKPREKRSWTFKRLASSSQIKSRTPEKREQTNSNRKEEEEDSEEEPLTASRSISFNSDNNSSPSTNSSSSPEPPKGRKRSNTANGIVEMKLEGRPPTPAITLKNGSKPNLFVDDSSVPQRVAWKSEEKLAQVAEAHAKVCAANIKHLLKGNQKMEKYKSNALSRIVILSLGPRQSVIFRGNTALPGNLGSKIKSIVEFKSMKNLPSYSGGDEFDRWHEVTSVDENSQDEASRSPSSNSLFSEAHDESSDYRASGDNYFFFGGPSKSDDEGSSKTISKTSGKKKKRSKRSSKVLKNK